MAEVRLDAKPVSPEDANFFVAVCALSPQAGAPAFVHIPTAANVLRERSEHIQLLAGWLEESRREHEQLLERHRDLELELEERNRWAEQLNQELQHARGDIERLNTELAERATSYESKIATLEQEKDTQSRWALETSRELTQCVEMLHVTEKTVEERTIWAKSLDRQVEHLEAMLGAVEGSRWFRLGRAFKLSPELRQK